FRTILVSTEVWKGFGYGAIIYLAALTGIDPGLYEASSIDGANRFQQLWHVTLPGILPTIMLISALNLGDILNAGFDQVFTLYNPIVFETGDIIDTYVYRVGLLGQQYSFATAVGLLKSVVGFTLMITANELSKKLADVCIWIVILLMTASCLLPLINMVSISFSDSASASANLVGLLPINFNLDSYKTLLDDTQFWRSFMISIERVVLGVSLNLVLTILMAYPLSKTSREFKAKNIYMYTLIFAMLFSGGLIPMFIVVKNLGLIDTIWALILPGAVPIFNVILMMNFFKSVP